MDLLYTVDMRLVVFTDTVGIFVDYYWNRTSVLIQYWRCT